MNAPQRRHMCSAERCELTRSADMLRTADVSSQSLPELQLHHVDAQHAHAAYSHCSRSLLRRSSHPASKLPLLNLSALREHVPTREEVSTPRRNVERIGRSFSRVKPYLYVGSRQSVREASAIHNNRITHIINLDAHLYHNQHAHVKYLSLSIRDDVRESIDDFFDVCIAFINEARRGGGACGVICTQGISRSASVAVAYLMSMENASMDDALRTVRISRPIIAPNGAFLEQLSAFEGRLRAGRRSDWIGKLSYVGSADKVLVARNVRAVHVENREDEVFIIEKARFGGLAVWKGSAAPEHVWKEALRVAKQMGMRMAAECELRGLRTARRNVQLIAHGDDARAAEHCVRHALQARDCVQTR
eukprot:TRINITY_DN123_c0_g1_i1.p2 TRINITY_DN123_c0_g1~~TRINITY_DN123_c0_g1_i1.p2  ORF type:complete len:362 (+),score=86.35 TRINITY_DN123_c0_g1_i1:5547-6632(+)